MICNVCRHRGEVAEIKNRMEGDLSICYMTCPECGQEYLISVTDPELRKQIGKYKRLRQAIRSGKAKVGTYRQAEALHKENTARCQSLIQEYLGIE